jgi:hypothetical protein
VKLLAAVAVAVVFGVLAVAIDMIEAACSRVASGARSTDTGLSGSAPVATLVEASTSPASHLWGPVSGSKAALPGATRPSPAGSSATAEAMVGLGELPVLCRVFGHDVDPAGCCRDCRLPVRTVASRSAA